MAIIHRSSLRNRQKPEDLPGKSRDLSVLARVSLSPHRILKITVLLGLAADIFEKFESN